MPLKIYFKHEKTGKKYQFVRWANKEKTAVVLKGEYAEFMEPFSVERFKKHGYTLMREGDSDAIES